MSVKLTCAIVRDLLPSYVEGLTSGETAAAVEAHLAFCPECARLRDELAGSEAEPAAEEAKEVDYLRKVKRRGRRRIALAILCTVALFIAGLALKVFVIGVPAQAQELAVTQFQEENGVLVLTAETPYSATSYWGWKVERGGNAAYVTARSVLVSPLIRNSGGQVEIPLEGLDKVYLCGALVWQEGNRIEARSRRLYELKTPYIGDAPAVGEILSALDIQNLGEFTTSIRTSERPYRWTVEFTGVYSGAAEERLNREMEPVAYQMLALVDNMDEFAWTYAVPGGETAERVLTAADAGAALPELAERWNELNGGSRAAPASIKACGGSPAAVQRLRDLLECLNYAQPPVSGAITVIPPEEGQNGYIFVN